MKLKTKRNRLFFRRELFSYLTPMILIVRAIDNFISFIRCKACIGCSMPCTDASILLDISYGIPFILSIILSIFFSYKLHKVKKQIEYEFLESTESSEGKSKDNEDIINKDIRNDDKEISNKMTKKRQISKKISSNGMEEKAKRKIKISSKSKDSVKSNRSSKLELNEKKSK